MSDKINLKLRPEFTYELVLGVPYAKWLHDRGKLGIVKTSNGMSPYYYFADSVQEVYDRRTIDNQQSGVLDLPNSWIHHNALAVFGKDYGDMTDQEKIEANGVLDYSKWTPPDYSEEYSGDDLELEGKVIVINNQFNIEKGRAPTRYFNFECLYKMFETLTDAGYTVVYNRPNNTEFVLDENEMNTRHNKMSLVADVEGVGTMNDYQLTDYFDNVYLFSKISGAQTPTEYNEFQLKLFDRAEGFIGLVGGAGTLSCFYKKPTIMYGTVSRAIAEGYWKPESYYQKLSGGNAYPVIDKRDDIIERGSHDYSGIFEHIEKLFTHENK